MKNYNNFEQKEIKELIEKIEKLILKEKIFSEFLYIINDGISINYKGYIIYCNEKYAEIFGYQRKELIGKNILMLCSPKTKDFWEKILEKEQEGEYETLCIKKDGKEIYVRLSIKNIKIEKKNLRVMSVRDMTDEKLKLERIKDSEEKYKILTETLLDGIIVIDLKGKILFSNIIGANLFGFEKSEEFIGKNIFDFVKEKEMFNNDLKLIYKNKGGYLIEHEIRDSKGSRFIIESIGRKIIFREKEAFLLCFRDVTERKIIIDNLKEAINTQKQILIDVVITLSETLTQKDLYTSIHQKRVAELVVEIAKELKIPESLIEGLKIASLLHDIGKIYIPTDILLKPGDLTEIEWEFIKMHPEYGANIVKNIKFPWDISKIIYQHHERINGSGYPLGLKNKEIIFEAKILAVADVIEAMSSNRHYRVKKYTINETLTEIKNNSGILYDKDVVETTIKVFKKGFNFKTFYVY